MAGFLGKKQYAAIPLSRFTRKLSKDLCLECSICAMFVMYVEQIMVLPIKIIKHRNPIACMDYFHGIHDGWKYVHSNEYKKVPKFDKYVK